MTKTPYVILCSGQSNMARINPEVDTSIAADVQFWRYGVRRHGESAGDGFDSGDKSPGNYAIFYAAAVAKQMPDKQIYVVNISRGATNLLQWLEGTVTEDKENMWNAIVSNVTAALEFIPGKDTIDEVIWWGHESDAANKAGTSATAFKDDFLKVIKQIDTQSWGGDGSYPILLHKIHPGCNPYAEQINYGIELIALAQPKRISIADATNFNFDDNIHLDGDQKEQAALHALTTKCAGESIPTRAINPNQIINGSFSLEPIEGATNASPKPAHWTLADGTALSIKNGIVTLSAGSIAQNVQGKFKAGSLVTVSMEDLSQNLTITLGDMPALMTAGPDRRQATFLLRKPNRHEIQVSIASEDGKPVTFSKMKFEYGGAYTAYFDETGSAATPQAPPSFFSRLKFRILGE